MTCFLLGEGILPMLSKPLTSSKQALLRESGSYAEETLQEQLTPLNREPPHKDMMGWKPSWKGATDNLGPPRQLPSDSPHKKKTSPLPIVSLWKMHKHGLRFYSTCASRSDQSPTNSFTIPDDAGQKDPIDELCPGSWP